MAARITEEFGTADWNPLILEVKDDYARSLAAARVADVLVVNPIRDGMNLVAEEGPVLSDRGCALVLSREAGAAALLGSDALLVNPYDVSATANAMHQALLMPDDERRRRCTATGRRRGRQIPRPMAHRPARRAAGWLAPGGRPPGPPACAPRPAVVPRRHTGRSPGRRPGSLAGNERLAVGPAAVPADSTGHSPGPTARVRWAGNERLAVTAAVLAHGAGRCPCPAPAGPLSGLPESCWAPPDAPGLEPGRWPAGGLAVPGGSVGLGPRRPLGHAGRWLCHRGRRRGGRLLLRGTSDSAAALTTFRPGMPSARRARTAANAARSPRSSPQNMTDRAARSADSSRRATPLSIPGGRSSMTWRPGSTVSPACSARASSGPRSRASAASGSAVPRVCTASACPLSSMRVPSGAPAAPSTPGRSRRTAATPGGAAGATTRPPSQRSQP